MKRFLLTKCGTPPRDQQSYAAAALAYAAESGDYDDSTHSRAINVTQICISLTDAPSAHDILSRILGPQKTRKPRYSTKMRDVVERPDMIDPPESPGVTNPRDPPESPDIADLRNMPGITDLRNPPESRGIVDSRCLPGITDLRNPPESRGIVDSRNLPSIIDLCNSLKSRDVADPRGPSGVADLRGPHGVADPRGPHGVADPRGPHGVADPRGPPESQIAPDPRDSVSVSSTYSLRPAKKRKAASTSIEPTDQRCKFPNCPFSRRYGDSSTHIAEFCERHRKPGQVLISATCIAVGCGVMATFGDPANRKRLTCGAHKLPGFVHLSGNK